MGTDVFSILVLWMKSAQKEGYWVRPEVPDVRSMERRRNPGVKYPAEG